jgi:hypothetical protein
VRAREGGEKNRERGGGEEREMCYREVGSRPLYPVFLSDEGGPNSFCTGLGQAGTGKKGATPYSTNPAEAALAEDAKPSAAAAHACPVCCKPQLMDLDGLEVSLLPGPTTEVPLIRASRTEGTRRCLGPVVPSATAKAPGEHPSTEAPA